MNLATVHTIAAVGDAGAAAADKLRSSTPEDRVKSADTFTFDGLRLEQEATSGVALRAEKRRPVTDMSLNAVELCEGAVTKDTVRAMLAVVVK